VSHCQTSYPLAFFSSSFTAAEVADFLFLVILLAGKWSLGYSGLGALDFLSKPLIHTNPAHVKTNMKSIFECENTNGFL
jgi:hypothetical protein